MKVEALKEKFLGGMELWLESRVDEMLSSNPALAIPSIYMKKGCHNIIKKYKCKIEDGIDDAILFIADESGEINGDTLFADAMELFRGMEEKPFDMGFLKGTIGKGKVSITLPDNVLMNIIFGNKKTITFDESDFLELKNLLME